MKKLFGGIELTWKKLIIFAVLIGIYTGIVAMIPITKDTSFRDIAIQFEWWILFGVIIIQNSKSPLDSALKCFVFFLISQPLVYLIQVPFSWMSWSLFKYYKYWFIFTLLTFPMGFVGYYTKKKNVLSMIILLPMLLFLMYLAGGYLSSALENFPNHILSFIACIIFIIIMILNILEDKILRIISFIVVIISFIIYILLSNNGITNPQYEAYKTIDNYGFTRGSKLEVTSFSAVNSSNGDVVLIENGDTYTFKLIGSRKGKYYFTITENDTKEYDFEYYYSQKRNEVVLRKKN